MKYCSPSYSSALEIRWVSLCAFAKNSQYIVWARASPVWPCMHVHYLPKQSNYLLPSGLKFFPTVASCTICTKSQAAMLLCPPPPPPLPIAQGHSVWCCRWGVGYTQRGALEGARETERDHLTIGAGGQRPLRYSGGTRQEDHWLWHWQTCCNGRWDN